jgi:hypothetical protein
MTDVKENIQNIQNVIKKCAIACGRNVDAVNLVAVSKRQDMSRIQEALDAGHRLFGENKVQEAYAHWDEKRADYPDLKLHLIGPLQTNKVKDAVKLFDCIETVDREKLARKLSDEMKKQDRHLPCFIQVNIGNEEQKAGIALDELDDFYNFCTQEVKLDIKGLMCIPPLGEPSALYFSLMKKYAEDLKLDGLSMGMSSDFEKAIPLGATYVRVGTSIFGSRDA